MRIGREDKMIRKGLAILVIILFIGMIYTPSISSKVEQSSMSTLGGDTLYVGGNGPGNYTKIQDAIDNANEGDTVFVYDDSSPYLERLKIETRINLIGEDKGSTIIDGESSGIVIQIFADGVQISGFTIQRSGVYGGHGIRVESNDNTIYDNVFHDNPYGIMLVKSENNTINDNVFTNERAGIVFNGNCTDNIIFGNIFIGDGLLLWNGDENRIFNNTVNGKPLIYLEDESNLLLEGDAGQIVLVDCENITVENYIFKTVATGIQLLRSSNCLIAHNRVTEGYYSIYLNYFSNNNTIYGNMINESYLGLYGYQASNGNSISSNSFFRCERGIEFDGVTDNVIYNNYFEFCELSIGIWSSYNMNISENIFYLADTGLNLIKSNSSTILKNWFTDCTIGIIVTTSWGNSICKNTFEGELFRVKWHALLSVGLRDSNDSYFLNNFWSGNYWGRSRILPKPIFGLRLFHPFIFVIILPVVQFDWHPAQEPYDTGGNP